MNNLEEGQEKKKRKGKERKEKKKTNDNPIRKTKNCFWITTVRKKDRGGTVIIRGFVTLNCVAIIIIWLGRKEKGERKEKKPLE